LLDERLRTMLVEAIADLPSREKMVMGMHYEKEMNLREIGEVLGVSESRVCQLHTQAVVRLRSRLRNL
ncbi:MAG: sigma-70 family RNA polymerase sigma factor, partial [Nitrosomonadaceae bacterium]